LRLLLEAEPTFDVVGTAGNDLDASGCTIRLRPDVVVLDMELPGAPGLLRSVVPEADATKVIELGMQESDDGVVACTEAGAAGWLARDASLDQLVSGIHSAARGEMDCSPRLVGRLAERVATLPVQVAERGANRQLTAGESEIVGLIEEGLSNKQIAGRLTIELSTVNHRHAERLRCASGSVRNQTSHRRNGDDLDGR
jgi:DNA-binding NarL/FixJ family response regulator